MLKKKDERATEIKVMNDRADEWNRDFPIGTEVAVVQDDGSRKIMFVCQGALIATGEDGKIVIEAGVADHADPSLLTIEAVVNIRRIRKRAIDQKKVSDALRVILTEAEIKEAGACVADGLGEVANLKSNLDSMKASINSQIKMKESEIAEKAGLVRNGYEVRPVECIQITDFDLGRVVTIRKDTGEQVGARPITLDERGKELTLFPEAQHVEEPAVPTEECETAQEGPQEPPQGDGLFTLPLTSPQAEKRPQAPGDGPGRSEIEAAIDVLKDTRRASASVMAKKMNVSTRRAIQILDHLTVLNILGPAKNDGSPRDILVDLDAVKFD
jgi:DNA segregation ATPase FtsK/SpoIIIE-like protein